MKGKAIEKEEKKQKKNVVFGDPSTFVNFLLFFLLLFE